MKTITVISLLLLSLTLKASNPTTVELLEKGTWFLHHVACSNATVQATEETNQMGASLEFRPVKGVDSAVFNYPENGDVYCGAYVLSNNETTLTLTQNGESKVMTIVNLDATHLELSYTDATTGALVTVYWACGEY